MKLFKRFVSWTIWGIIALNLMLVGVSHIPAAQRIIGSKVADAVAQKLGTHVSIGRVDMGLLNRLIMDDVLIYDQQQKEMVKIARLSVKIDIGPLTQGKISISSAQLFGAHLTLYKQHANAQSNFQFALDSLASKDTTNHTPLDLRINSFIMRRASVRYDQNDVAQTEGVFNTRHLYVSDLSADISLKTLTDDSLNVNIKRLGFNEQSGLTVSRIDLKLEAGRRNALLTNLSVVMPSSKLQIDTLKAAYQLNEQGLVPGTLSFSGRLHDTGITPSDLRCFLNPLKNYQRPIQIETAFNGTDERIAIPELCIATSEKDIDIQANGWIEHWDKQPAGHVEIGRLVLSENSIDFLAKAIPQIPQELTRIGNLQLTGVVNRTSQGATSLLSNISSGIGAIDVQMDMAADKTIKGQLTSARLDLQKLLNQKLLGNISTQLSFSGQLRDLKHPDIQVDGKVNQLDFDNYSYSNITLNGHYAQGQISGAVSIDDPKVSAQLRGELAMAHDLNDAQGHIHISHLRLSSDHQLEDYQLDNLIITSGYDEGIHFLTLKSDFADAQLKGQFDYKTLAQSFANAIGSRLPTLPGLPPLNKQTDNNFSLRLLMSKTDWLERFLGVNLELQKPLSLEARVNDLTRTIMIDGELPAFSYNGAIYTNANIQVKAPSDTLTCDVEMTKLMDNGQNLSLNLKADASHNLLNTSLIWDNHQKDAQMSGKLNAIVRLYQNLENKSEAHVRIMPSHVVLKNSTWEVEPSDLLYSEKRLLVDHFTVHHGAQHIIVDGTASKNSTDSLVVDLNDVEVDYILDLVNFHSVEFSGKATGRATASQLFGEFAAQADLQVNDFKFENGRMGVLHAKAQWNQEKEQIDINAVSDDGPDAKTYISGYVSPTHNTINLDFQAEGTYVDFMHNFTSSFLSQLTGHADGDVKLSGTLDNINLTGKLIVDGEATVTPLNTTYRLERDTVIMIPDEIELKRLAIYDKDGNIGYLSGGIHHQHLTNLSFDLSVEAENLLAYDFKEFGESTFYGTVYASGDVAIHGHGKDVVIDCNVTPQKNSVFVYNASRPDAISSQEFIEWEDVSSQSSDRKSEAKASPSRATDTNIYINFLVNTTPEATLRLLMDANTNDYITLNGDGTIRATFHNKGAFNMFGTYTVDHGTYGITIQNIIKKNFTFNRGGTIVFGGDPYQAALNLQAVYTVNGVSLSDLNIGNSFTNNSIRVNCLMNIGGQPAAPQVDFDLEMPTVNADEQQMVRSIINGQQEMNQQVVYLLAIGRFYNQGANNNENQQSDQTSLAMQSFLSGTLSTQINTLLSQVIKNENWNFGANISTGNEGWHNAEYEGIINGRMLNNRLLFSGQFGYRDNATKATPSFIGDFDLQYLLFPNGNLALKVYNQTNDRYFTKSSLNTQGIGIIMKKDFNGLRDLFSTKKKKKKSSTTNVQENHSK